LWQKVSWQSVILQAVVDSGSDTSLMAPFTPSLAAEAGPLSYALILLARAHREYARGLLDETGLYPGQELLLMCLFDREPTDQSELATMLDIEAPTVTKMLQRLEQQGLITRQRLESNRRRVIVSSTAKGRRLRPKIKRLWTQLEAATTSGLSSRQRTEAMRLVIALHAGLRPDDVASA
jgi:DNA-binding MarR family transcriptional regulator